MTCKQTQAKYSVDNVQVIDEEVLRMTQLNSSLESVHSDRPLQSLERSRQVPSPQRNSKDEHRFAFVWFRLFVCFVRSFVRSFVRLFVCLFSYFRISPGKREMVKCEGATKNIKEKKWVIKKKTFLK